MQVSSTPSGTFYRSTVECVHSHSDHLGNVRAVVPRVETASLLATLNRLKFFSNYSPFGMELVGRTYTSGGSQNYRYGFNGKEQDLDIMGQGNIYDYGFRIYNPRIGRFLSVDPLTKSYPSWSPYPFAMNRPINGVDLDGKEWFPSIYTTVVPVMVATYYSVKREIYEGTVNVTQGMAGTGVPEGVGQQAASAMRINQAGEGARQLNSVVTGVGHGVLDAAGFVPVAGEFADALNASWYSTEGDAFNAGISVVSALGGDFAKGGRWAVKGDAGVAFISEASGAFKANIPGTAGDYFVSGMKRVSDDGKSIIIEDMLVHPASILNNPEFKGLTGYRRLVEDWARHQGFSDITFEGVRTTGANPGKKVSVTTKLNNE